MNCVNGLLDYSTPWKLPNIYLFTGNPIVKKNGALVMGRGAAKQVRDTYPKLDLAFGAGVIVYPERRCLFIRLNNNPQQIIGWFQVKKHWAKPADLEIIKEACDCLSVSALMNPEVTFHMNCPGIGNGRLKWDDVRPILETMPDNVWIYK